MPRAFYQIVLRAVDLEEYYANFFWNAALWNQDLLMDMGVRVSAGLVLYT